MIIAYTPKDGEPEHYDARTLLASEASIVARTIDLKWPQVKEGLAEDDLDAMRAVVWILKKRHNASLRYGDFDPGVDELTTRYDKGEIENWIDSGFAIGLADPTVTPEQIALALRQAPESAADPEHARAYIERCRAEAESGGKGSAPVEPTAEAGPEPTTSSPSTSATPEPSTSVSSPTS